MQFVIISGMSGAGKSKAASDLEDLGFYCVDNMPAEMIPQFAQLCLATKGRYEKVALVTDVRASMTFDALFQALQKLDEMHLQYSIYYIEASTEVIIKRYKETRRLHPLMKDGSTLADAIGRERELLAPVRNRASAIIDTSIILCLEKFVTAMKERSNGTPPQQRRLLSICLLAVFALQFVFGVL